MPMYPEPERQAADLLLPLAPPGVVRSWLAHVVFADNRPMTDADITRGQQVAQQIAEGPPCPREGCVRTGPHPFHQDDEGGWF